MPDSKYDRDKSGRDINRPDSQIRKRQAMQRSAAGRRTSAEQWSRDERSGAAGRPDRAGRTGTGRPVTVRRGKTSGRRSAPAVNPNVIVVLACVVVFILVFSFVRSRISDPPETPVMETESETGTDFEAMTETESETETETMAPESSGIPLGELQTTPAAPTVTEPETFTEPADIPTGKKVSFDMVFAGDVWLGGVIGTYRSQGIRGIISDELLEEMQDAALTMINQDFPLGTGGSKDTSKESAHCLDPIHAKFLQNLGVDLVTLANDHCLDYGRSVLSQTFKVLDSAGIGYVGAGTTPERAAQWQSYEFGQTRVAFLAASRVIPNADWNVANSTPGVLSTYDPSQLNQQIAAAREENDIVIVYVHWGVDKSSVTEEYQTSLAHSYIDNGADLVIGSHPRSLQGVEYYRGKPIVYSLGRFIYQNSNPQTVLLKVNVSKTRKLELQLIPAAVTEDQVHRVTGDEEEAILDHIRELSAHARISKSGIISKAH